jgi:uncharacterized protein YjbJ (UPF0337 family)
MRLQAALIGRSGPRRINTRTLERKESAMDQDRIKGKAKDVAGRAQEAWGDLTNDPAHKAEGKDKQVEGKVQNTVGKVKDAVRNVTDPDRL